MATKNGLLCLKEQANNHIDNSSQYSNFNLNQSHKNGKKHDVSFINSYSKSLNNHKNQGSTIVEKIGEKRNLKLWDKSILIESKTVKSFFNAKNEGEGKVKNEWKNDSKISSSSTLSLHIAAYENSDEGDIGFGEQNKGSSKIQKSSNLIKNASIISTSIIQNSFEFPRQQTDEKSSKPDVMQFSASQQLINPDQTSASVEIRSPPICRGVPESLWTNALWHSSLKDDYNHRKIIFVLRAFENVSSVFGPNWLRMATQSGKYHSFDMNMPYTIPALKFSTLQTDPPLSVFGKFAAQASACSLRNQLFKTPYIICAPSLRCVQTACTFADVMQAKVYILEELAEPEIILEYGNKITAFGNYLSIDELRKCGFNVQGLRLNERHAPNEEESDIGIISRISRALQELTTHSPKGPALIVGDALVLKIANSISTLPDGYSDPLQAKPFIVPSILSNEEDAVEMSRFDFTQLDEHFPFGTMNVFLRKKDDDGAPVVMRIPHSMPKISVCPGGSDATDDKERELKSTKPENAISIQQQHGPVRDDSSEISIN